MLNRPVGALTIACAAIDDVTAWFLIALAITISVVGNASATCSRRSARPSAFTLLMVLVVRRILARMADRLRPGRTRFRRAWFAAIIVGVLLSAYITETINIAFIFGAFIMGMIMPRHARMNEEITRRIEDFVVTLLLPLFFAYTGLRMNVGLLDRPELWLLTLLLIAIAIVGKLAGAAIAARVAGYDWKASAVIGSLMNTRGLTELIVLNLALDVGRDLQRAVRDAGDHGRRHDADGRAAAQAARPEERVRQTGRGRVRGCGARRRPGSSGAAGPGAIDSGRARDRRRHGPAGRAGRAAGRIDSRPGADRGSPGASRPEARGPVFAPGSRPRTWRSSGPRGRSTRSASGWRPMASSHAVSL